MKINIELDLTPEELRAFLGLPDVKPLQDELLRKAGEQIASGASAVDPSAMMQPFLTPHAGALDAFQRAFWQSFANASGTKADDGDAAATSGSDDGRKRGD